MTSLQKKSSIECEKCLKKYCLLDKIPHPYHDPSIKCTYKNEDDSLNTYGLHKCPSCYRNIFKDGGCRHMSCPCGSHFCAACPNNKKINYKNAD
jgi:hypothetical protein